ncbi:hypothetical protein GCM10009862_29520 [Microbacterium binotii]|uniref:Uncharacterized protein n=1 Tax=Microbacterium binotii TaxID=462710 RepID=A0ABN3PMA9_9MICO
MRLRIRVDARLVHAEEGHRGVPVEGWDGGRRGRRRLERGIYCDRGRRTDTGDSSPEEELSPGGAMPNRGVVGIAP